MSERDELKAEAQSKGIEFPNNIPMDKLRELVNGESKMSEKTEVQAVGTLRTFSTTEYAEYSKANGRTMGRKDGEKTKLSSQELRVLINSKWSPREIMDKHGIDENELQSVINVLSMEELRGKNPITFNEHGFQKVR